MKVTVLIVICLFSVVSIGNSCNVASWGYSSSSYYDEYNPGPQVGFGFGPGFFGYTGGFGLGSLGLVMALLMSRHPHPPPPRVVHHHHHHYYKENPGGGYEYQYKSEGPKWGRSTGGNPSAGPEARGPKTGPFSSFFRNMFYRR